jgi:hypothetical protein
LRYAGEKTAVGSRGVLREPPFQPFQKIDHDGHPVLFGEISQHPIPPSYPPIGPHTSRRYQQPRKPQRVAS